MSHLSTMLRLDTSFLKESKCSILNKKKSLGIIVGQLLGEQFDSMLSKSFWYPTNFIVVKRMFVSLLDSFVDDASQIES